MSSRNFFAALPVLAIALAPINAFAFDDEPGSEPRSQPATQAETKVDLANARYSDANSDRVLLFSTAQTHPQGTVFFSDYEIVVLQIGYAFTDSFQLTLTGLPPLIKNQPYVFDLTGKYNVYRSDLFNAAVVAAGTVVAVDDESEFLGRIGGVTSWCINATCRSSVSLNAGVGLNGETLDQGILPITLAGGLIVGVTDLFSVLVEPAYAFAVKGGSGGGVQGIEGFLLSYGARLSGGAWGVDLAFVRPIGGDDLNGPFILGLPFLSFTYRWLPDA